VTSILPRLPYSLHNFNTSPPAHPSIFGPVTASWPVASPRCRCWEVLNRSCRHSPAPARLHEPNPSPLQSPCADNLISRLQLSLRQDSNVLDASLSTVAHHVLYGLSDGPVPHGDFFLVYFSCPYFNRRTMHPLHDLIETPFPRGSLLTAFHPSRPIWRLLAFTDIAGRRRVLR